MWEWKIIDKGKIGGRELGETERTIERLRKRKRGKTESVNFSSKEISSSRMS